MFVICKQIKKHNLRHIGKALQVFLTNKTVLAEQKETCDFTQWLGPKLSKLKKAVQQVALKCHE